MCDAGVGRGVQEGFSRRTLGTEPSPSPMTGKLGFPPQPCFSCLGRGALRKSSKFHSQNGGGDCAQLVRSVGINKTMVSGTQNTQPFI